MIVVGVAVLCAGQSWPVTLGGTAIAGQIELEMKKRKEAKLSLESSETGRWTLLDYGDVVVHVQVAEERIHYALERLWKDCPSIPLDIDTSR